MEQLEQDSILMSPHPFNNFEVQKHYQNEPGVYWRIPKIKNEA